MKGVVEGDVGRACLHCALTRGVSATDSPRAVGLQHGIIGVRYARGNHATFDLRPKTDKVYNKSEEERAAIVKGTAGRVRAKRLASRASETPITMHSTAAERLHPPALLQSGTIGWPLLCPALHLFLSQTCRPT